MEKLMDICHVGYSYHTMQGETPALSNINFTVHKGDFLAVVGPSGCGKGMVLQGKQPLPEAGSPRPCRAWAIPFFGKDRQAYCPVNGRH